MSFWQWAAERSIMHKLSPWTSSFFYNDVSNAIINSKIWHLNQKVSNKILYFFLIFTRLCKKRDFGKSFSPICTFYYIECHPKFQFLSSRPFLSPKNHKFGGFTTLIFPIKQACITSLLPTIYYSHILLTQTCAYIQAWAQQKNFTTLFYCHKSTVTLQKLDTWQRKFFLPPLGVRGAPWVKIGGFKGSTHHFW